MAQADIEFLKAALVHYQACAKFFQAPIDLTMIQNRLSDAEASSEEDGSGGGSNGRSYQDFLLPLPDHLQSTEKGIPDPNQIQARREAKGMNTKQGYSDKNRQREALKAKNTLKNRPGAPAPQAKEEIRYSRKMKIAPRPGGYHSTEED